MADNTDKISCGTSCRNSMESDEILRKVWEDSAGISIGPDEIRKEYDSLVNRMKTAGIDPGKRQKRQIPAKIWHIAAIWLIPLCILGTGIAMTIGSMNKIRTITDVRYMGINTTSGERKEIILPDGSKVWLNSGSLLIYPDAFVGKERNVYLSGEGFFMISPDKKHPFYVHTADVTLKVLGTSFNISCYPDEKLTETTLMSGSVEVSVPSEPGEPFCLSPDQQLVYDQSSGEVRISKVNSEEFRSWTDGEILIYDKSLEETARILEKTYGIKIIITSKEYSDARIMVHFKDNEPMERVFGIICKIIPGINISINDDVVVIR